MADGPRRPRWTYLLDVCLPDVARIRCGWLPEEDCPECSDDAPPPTPFVTAWALLQGQARPGARGRERGGGEREGGAQERPKAALARVGVRTCGGWEWYSLPLRSALAFWRRAVVWRGRVRCPVVGPLHRPHYVPPGGVRYRPPRSTPESDRDRDDRPTRKPPAPRGGTVAGAHEAPAAPSPPCPQQ